MVMALSLSLASAWSPAWSQVRLPSLGDSASDDLSVGAERRYGEQIMRELRRDPAYLDDPVLLEYLQSLWDPLVKAAQTRGDIGADTLSQFAWQVFLVLDRSVNAFALPGGYVGIHLGLISLTGSSDELASVLAHELSDITQRHIARMLTQQQQQSPLMIGSMILGLLAASRSPQAAQAMVVGGQAVAVQTQLNFSRDMEREADRVGYGVATQAGYEPAGFVSMFEKLLHASRLNDSGGYPYLRSHPLTTERIADMQSRQQLLPVRTSQVGPDLPHSLLSARARVLAQPSVDALRFFSQDANSCLFATAGFFQGVDIPGDTLTLVTIDRIPFPRPDDPLLSARRELLGPAAFGEIDIPRASMLLAQAVGRLIRTSSDRGVVAVFDRRLGAANYRWKIVSALPPMRRTRERTEAEQFLREITT